MSYPSSPPEPGPSYGGPQFQPGAPPPPAPDGPAQPGGYPQQGGYQQQGGYGQPLAPVPPKKSKAGKIILIVLAIVLVLCGGGIAATLFMLKDEVGEVVEASQTRLVEPDTLAGRPKITDPSLEAVADQVIDGMKGSVPNSTSTVAAFYGDPANEDLVMVIGLSGIIANPKQELDDAIVELSGAGGLQLANVTSTDAGPLGGDAKCGDAKAGGVDLGVCVWTDRGSLGLIAIYYATGNDVEAEFTKIRGEIQKR